jgi:hypothetical protein
MGGKGPSLPELQQPIAIEDVLKEQRNDYDCLPCRLMGTMLFCEAPASSRAVLTLI